MKPFSKERASWPSDHDGETALEIQARRPNTAAAQPRSVNGIAEMVKPTVFSITEGHVEGICIIAITGWFTQANAGLFAEIANEHIPEGHRFIVLELSETKFIDSTCMSALFGTFGRIKTRMGQLVIAGAKGKILEILHISTLDTVLDIFESLDKAVAALSSGEIPSPLRILPTIALHLIFLFCRCNRLPLHV